jgi:hypothetical protein
VAVLRDSDSFRTRFLVWGIPKFFYWFSHLLFRSCRITYVGKEHEDQFLRHGAPICFAGDHQGMLYLPFHFRDRDGVIMVSASRDGDLIAHTMARFGLRSARGSSKHGGDAALQGMIDEVNAARCSAGMIVDGPLGPAGIAKRGVILLARETGLPIVPGNWWARPRLQFGSWDRTILPLPFARMVFAFEPALQVPPDADDATVESLREELTRRLARARATARAACEPELRRRAAAPLPAD